MALAAPSIDRVLAAVDDAAAEIVAFTSALIRVPTVNPPGEAYEDCARLIGDRLAACGFDVEYHAAEGRPEHTRAHPRVNVVGLRRGRVPRPNVHLNGHLDVVPAGDGWTVDPFGGVVRDGRIYGRGSCDMKAGIAAAVYAAEAIRRAGVEINGSIEISGTVDEESGGFAGVAWLAERRRLSAERNDYVIIPEPLNPDQICIGHRGVYWFEVTTHGRIGHGSMPFLGVNAIDHMGIVLDQMRRELLPVLAARTTQVPVVPAGARHATLNINGISGGQPVDGIQTPCVADVCRAVFDRRFLLEEGFDATKEEIVALLEKAAASTPPMRYSLRDLMIVHPTRTPDGSPVIGALERAIRRVFGRAATHVASPGTYDQKHFDRIAGIPHCVAYGPGILDLAHQPDEWCGIDDLVNSTKVLALALLELTGTSDVHS
jgi:succinyl-diaminopimelate desuccinylase